MGGGGGDGGYEARQAETEAKKQQARDALNLMFGVAPTSGRAAPTRDAFTRIITEASNPDPDFGGGLSQPRSYSQFDEAGYNAALDAFKNQSATAAKNKTARDALYSKVRGDAFTAGRRGLDEYRDRAQRDNRFALFAQGLNGGSVDVDQNALLGRTYSEGLLDLGAKADATRTDMMSNDEQTRLGLLQSIDAGMDQGSALSSALNQMRINSDRAGSSAQGVELGDLFADAGLLYTQSQAARGRQAAQDFWNTNSPTSRPRASRGSTGIITSTG